MRAVMLLVVVVVAGCATTTAQEKIASATTREAFAAPLIVGGAASAATAVGAGGAAIVLPKELTGQALGVAVVSGATGLAELIAGVTLLNSGREMMDDGMHELHFQIAAPRIVERVRDEPRKKAAEPPAAADQ